MSTLPLASLLASDQRPESRQASAMSTSAEGGAAEPAGKESVDPKHSLAQPPGPAAKPGSPLLNRLKDDYHDPAKERSSGAVSASDSLDQLPGDGPPGYVASHDPNMRLL